MAAPRHRRLPGPFLTLLALLAYAVYGAPVWAQLTWRSVSESSLLRLEWSDELQSIRVVDRRGGEPWTTTLDPRDPELGEMSEMWSTGVRSIVSLQYVDLEDRYLHLNYANPLLQRARTEVDTASGALELTYSFDSLGLEIRLRMWIEDDRLHLLIPEQGMRETGENGFYSVEPLPFLGAMGDDPEDYFVYPDGCGAIMRGKGPVPGARRQRWLLYSPEYPELSAEPARSTEMRERQDQAALPVFGVRRGKSAFLAAITQGDHRAAINLSPSGYVLPFHRLSFELLYRRPYRDARETESSRASELYHDRVERERLTGDREVVFILLAGAQADYSGMANAYRRLLIRRGEIRGTAGTPAKMPLALDVFMGILEPRILVDRFVTMTSFAEVRLMLEELGRRGVTAVDVNLLGWSAGGYGRYPEPARAARSMGGDRALAALGEYARSSGARLFLQVNPVDADRAVRGYSLRRDVTHTKSGSLVSDELDERLLLSPAVALRRFTSRSLPTLTGFGVSGVCLARLGWLVFDDYNDRSPATRADTIATWRSFLSRSREAVGAVSVRGPNAYALGLVDRLHDVPDRDTGLFVTDEVIPFYQIVVHGMVPYGSANPGNLSHDPVEQKLRWVEYGFLPSYELTWESPELLKHTGYNELFSSRFADWVGPLSATWREMDERLGDLWKRTILTHRRLTADVVEVGYDDGSLVVVNYGADAFRRGALTVGSRDYAVLRPEGAAP